MKIFQLLQTLSRARPRPQRKFNALNCRRLALFMRVLEIRIRETQIICQRTLISGLRIYASTS